MCESRRNGSPLFSVCLPNPSPPFLPSFFSTFRRCPAVRVDVEEWWNLDRPNVAVGQKQQQQNSSKAAAVASVQGKELAKAKSRTAVTMRPKETKARRGSVALYLSLSQHPTAAQMRVFLRERVVWDYFLMPPVLFEMELVRNAKNDKVQTMTVVWVF